jgi:hypothetical protein
MRCLYSEYNISSAVKRTKEEGKREREAEKKKRMKLLYIVIAAVVATVLFSMYVSVRSDGGK